MSIYCWTLGEVALARLCKKVYAKVQIVKNEDGIFFDYKVLGITPKDDGSIEATKELCYYVETCVTKQKVWLPYTSLHLASRSRPFYGPAGKVLPPKPATKTLTTPKKRKIKEDYTLPLNVKQNHKEPDLNTTYDVRHVPLKQGKFENAFREFVRRGKEMIFDEYYVVLEKENIDLVSLDYLRNVDASTEDKLETVLKGVATVKEIENYLHQCWRYNFVHKQRDSNDGCDNMKPTSPIKADITLHTSWCLVCGKGDRLRECVSCPSSYHLACRKEWLITIIHRKNPPQKPQRPATLVEKILSSTRTKCAVQKERETVELCPSCMWGPRVGYNIFHFATPAPINDKTIIENHPLEFLCMYLGESAFSKELYWYDDVVWHKLGSCPWWPARVLAPGAVPSCLLSRSHSPHQWPLRYYEATKELCYYVETCVTKQKVWLPYTSLHLASRSRPFYGPAGKVLPPKPATKTLTTPKKRKIKEDYTLPLNVKQNHKEPDLNTTYDVRHVPLKQGKFENAFREFVRRGKEMIFDEYYVVLEKENIDLVSLDYLRNVDASTEDKLETVLKGVATVKEIENYLHQCWRYNFVHKQRDSNDGCDNMKPTSPIKADITLHTSWCLVCGKGDRLRECVSCPSSYHLACRKEWLITIIHRKNPPQKPQRPATLVEKILSSTRTKCAVQKERETVELCPSCMWGPRVGYDDVVWHKLGSCPWWPARVLAPGAVPSCLLSRSHSPHQWPLRYYGTLNHSWGDTHRMCLFLPSHTGLLETARDETLRQAVLDACDDYISVYLT